MTTTVKTGDDAAAELPTGPRGTVGIRIFGPVSIGMTEKVVRMRFGRPDEVRDVNFGTLPRRRRPTGSGRSRAGR